jgi:ATP-binding cassette subfamily B protein
VLIVVLSQQMVRAVAELHDALTWLLSAAATAGRHVRLLRLAQEGHQRTADHVPHHGPVTTALELRDVSFAYPDSDVQVLRSVNLALPRGAVVALVGENGAGKSTLLSIVLGLYTPTGGAVLVDGAPLRGWTSPQRRVSTGAFQEQVYYEFTLGRSIGIGDIDKLDDESRILGALDVVGARALVDALPDGLGEPIGRGDGRHDLSGGQWQRVAVARGHMSEAPAIRIFDEPSAALDHEAEEALFDALLEQGRELGRRHGTITIVVSHRLASVSAADVVVVLAGGEVEAAGTHHEVLERSARYAELYDIQASGYR